MGDDAWVLSHFSFALYKNNVAAIRIMFALFTTDKERLALLQIRDSQTLLHWAVNYRCPEAIDLLINGLKTDEERAAILGQVDNEGDSPLLFAVKYARDPPIPAGSQLKAIQIMCDALRTPEARRTVLSQTGPDGLTPHDIAVKMGLDNKLCAMLQVPPSPTAQ